MKHYITTYFSTVLTDKLYVRLTFVFLLVLPSCDFLDIDPPRTDLIKSTVFTNDATANAAILDIYWRLDNNSFASGTPFSLSFIASLSSDELLDHTTGTAQLQTQQFFKNNLVPQNTYIANFWYIPYQCIYRANAVLEGLSSSIGVSEEMRNQLEGEAKFIRAFCNFYLLNMFGDVPLVLTTDYETNAGIGRTPKDEVYEQIVADLLDAQDLLPTDYAFSNNARYRANKWVATAMLARVYLYMEKWTDAEAQATSVINETATYSLVTDLTKVFVNNSKEAIWQFETLAQFPADLLTFYIFSSVTNKGSLRSEFVSAFEAGDQRKALWVGTVTIGTNTYYFPRKYQSFTQRTESSTILRLSEQYLIRAEARANQDDFTGAQEDVNVIRTKAGLGDTPANDKPSLLLAIEQERKFELFTEWGHRWFDLKRTNRIDAVLSPIKTEWVPTAALYPIAETQILNDPAMKDAQNPGY